MKVWSAGLNDWAMRSSHAGLSRSAEWSVAYPSGNT